MPDDLTFYTNPMSRGRIARWMLEEAGRPYRTEVMEFGPSMKTPEYLAVNPMGKVPAIRHGETVVTECGAICAYLADVFPEKGLAPPPGDPARGPYYRWMFFASGPIEAAVTAKSFGFEQPTDPRKKGMLGYGSYEDVMDAIDHGVSRHDYIAGDTFTSADVYFGSQLGWGLMFGTIEKRQSFEKYWQRIANRPAAIRAREIDDALLPAKA
jgi:glutathione S-transferase